MTLLSNYDTASRGGGGCFELKPKMPRLVRLKASIFTEKTQSSLKLGLFLLSEFSLELLSLSKLYFPEQTTKRQSERNDCHAAKAVETDLKPIQRIV
jgi:hypothetical protein